MDWGLSVRNRARTADRIPVSRTAHDSAHPSGRIEVNI